VSVATARDAIPVEPIRRLIEGHIGVCDHGINHNGEEWGKRAIALSLRSGLSKTAIYDICKESYPWKTIRFGVADKIISKGLGNPWLWWEWPLLVFYLSVDLTEVKKLTYGERNCISCGEVIPTEHRACRPCDNQRRRERRRAAA